MAWLGGRNKFLGGTSSLFCVNSRGVWGHEKFIPAWIKVNKVRSKDSKRFSGRTQVISKKNTNLGLNLQSSSPILLISSVHSPRLGGGTVFVWGAHKLSFGEHRPRYAPRGTGSVMHPISFGSTLPNAKKYVYPSAFKCRKRVHVRTL